MNGRIIKGIGGFYYVHVPENGIYECRAKGIFRNRNEKPLVGDMVSIDITDYNLKTGNVIDILPRKNSLVRPAAANIDQVLLVFAASSPEPNLYLLDYFLIRMEYENIPVIICFNKTDLVDKTVIENYICIYRNSNARAIGVCAHTGEGFDDLREMLNGRLTALAGPSGTGKSSVMNRLYPEAKAETGDISRKLGRGKHTTRHSEIFCINKDSYLMDTPGFSSLGLPDIEAGELKYYFPEFNKYQDMCRFQGCIHKNEPDCAVKRAVEDKIIPKSRYESYILMFDEINSRKKW